MKCRKLVACLLLLALFITIAACGRGTNGTDDTPGRTGTGDWVYTGYGPLFDEPFTISILSSNQTTPDLGGPELPIIAEILRKANVVMEYEEVDRAVFNEVVMPRLAAGTDLPDIVKLPIRDGEMRFINAGLFTELTDFFDDLAIHTNRIFDHYPSIREAITTPDDRIWYFPGTQDITGGSIGMFINTDHLAALGMQMSDINDYTDLYHFMVAVRDGHANGHDIPDDVIPLYLDSGWMLLNMAPFWGAFNGFMVNDDGVVVHGMSTPEAYQFVSDMHLWFTEGLLFNEYLNGGWEELLSMATQNRISVTMRWVANVTQLARNSNPYHDPQEDDPIIQIIYPPLMGTHGNRYVLGRTALGPFYGISRDAEHPEKVFAFLDWLYSDEAMTTRAFGIEGEDHFVLADGTIEFSEDFRLNQDGFRRGRGASNDFLPLWTDFGSLFGGLLQITHGPVQEQIIIDIESYMYMPFEEFAFRSDEDAAVIQRYSGDIWTFVEENIHSFIIGSRSLSEWDNFVESLHRLNIEAVAAVHQQSLR